VASCADGSGFRPLYGPTASGVGVQAQMAAMDIAPIPGRVGQRIRNELVFQATGGGNPEPPKYKLEITVRESIGSTLVKSTGEALSQVYNLDATYRLIRISDKKVLSQGTSFARAEFERFQQIYSNVRARDDAEARSARQIADDLKTRLAVVLSRETAG
jgi:LPS-assembly lipoprotein